MTLTPPLEEFAVKVLTLATPSGQGEALGASPSLEMAGFQLVEWSKHLGSNNFQSFTRINFKGLHKVRETRQATITGKKLYSDNSEGCQIDHVICDHHNLSQPQTKLLDCLQNMREHMACNLMITR